MAWQRYLHFSVMAAETPPALPDATVGVWFGVQPGDRLKTENVTAP